MSDILDKVSDFRHTKRPIHPASTNILDTNDARTHSGNTTYSEREGA